MKTSKSYKPEVYNPSTREVLSCLKSESQWLHLLKGKNKPYDKLLIQLELHFDQMLLQNEYGYSVSGLSKKFNIKQTHFVKWIHQIYTDIFELNSLEPDLFKSEGIRHDLDFFYSEQYANFTLWLKVPLRKDEEFNWFFLKSKLRFVYFYVNSISHQYSNGEELINASLISGFPNTYRRFICEKALFYDKISLSESFQSQYTLDKRLKQIYPQ